MGRPTVDGRMAVHRHYPEVTLRLVAVDGAERIVIAGDGADVASYPANDPRAWGLRLAALLGVSAMPEVHRKLLLTDRAIRPADLSGLDEGCRQTREVARG